MDAHVPCHWQKTVLLLCNLVPKKGNKIDVLQRLKNDRYMDKPKMRRNMSATTKWAPYRQVNEEGKATATLPQDHSVFLSPLRTDLGNCPLENCPLSASNTNMECFSFNCA